MRCQIIAELATNHGGDLELAADMIRAAADAGADFVKTQGYQIKNLRHTDPQYEWFKQCELSIDAHLQLMKIAEVCQVQYLSTGYTTTDLERLSSLGLKKVKIGSGEGRSNLWVKALKLFDHTYVTLPWGRGRSEISGVAVTSKLTWLATVPLYPAPLETYGQIEVQPGYSDHHIGIDVARLAIAQSVTYLEKHFHLVNRGRNQIWNMTVANLQKLREWTEICSRASAGTQFEGRWIE